MILMLDNYDFFTWNIVQYLWQLGAEDEVHRNDEIDYFSLKSLSAQRGINSFRCAPLK